MDNIDARWEALEAKCRECTNCSLCETRTNCVFGTGNRNADLMFVGEAPGEQEVSVWYLGFLAWLRW